MRKRLTAGLLACSAALAFSGAAPALASSATDDAHPAIPCNPYPPGKKFNVTAVPSSATIRKGANINLVAVVTRGVGSDKKPCKYHLVALRYKSRPGKTVASHRTSDRGTAAMVAGPINGTLYYYFDMIYNGATYPSNVGIVHVH